MMPSEPDLPDPPPLVVENLKTAAVSPVWFLRPGLGEMVVLTAPKEEFLHQLSRSLLGLDQPFSGEVRVFGRNLFKTGERESALLRQRIGAVAVNGGLIANLRALENLLLPVIYHRGMSAVTQQQADTALARVGYDASPETLSGLLSLFQRKQIALARAMLMMPDLLIYDSLLLGLSPAEQEQLLAVTTEFHCENSQRISLFLTTSQNLAARIPAAVRVFLAKGERL
jgi:predicted ABC-type transport system involved in lysophospholipase L1 biosynthesis ATPase subunit